MEGVGLRVKNDLICSIVIVLPEIWAKVRTVSIFLKAQQIDVQNLLWGTPDFLWIQCTDPRGK